MPGMDKNDAAGRKTEDVLAAQMEALQERIDRQKERLLGDEYPSPLASSDVTLEQIQDHLHKHGRVPGDGYAPEAVPKQGRKIALPPEVFEADSTKAMLNAQLLECVGLMREAAWLYRNSPVMPQERSTFIHQTVSLMEASTKMGDTIRRLGGGEDPVPTTRHVMVVERGEGVRASLENE